MWKEEASVAERLIASSRFQTAKRQQHLLTGTIWSAPAERSGDGALVDPVAPAFKAASHFVCRRTPKMAQRDLAYEGDSGVTRGDRVWKDRR